MPKTKNVQITFYLILSFIAVIGIWIYIAEIDEIIRAEGAVEPAGKVRTVSSRFAGIVRELNIQVGDKVKENQVIVLMNEEEAIAALDMNTTSIANLQGEIARLEAETYNSKAINFPTNITPEIISDQSRLFLSRKGLLEHQTIIINSDIRQAENNLKEINQSLEGLRKLLAIKIEEHTIYKPLVEKGAEPKIILVQLRSNIQQLKNDVNTNQTQFSRTEIEIDILKQKQYQLLAEYKSAAEEAFSSKKNELRLLRTETGLLRERLRNSKLISPINGVVTKVEIAGVGTVVRAGEPILEIVPISENLMVKARLLPKDIASLKLGQSCNITLNAYDYTSYGKISGFISRIAQNTTTKENGEVYYDIWIDTRTTKLSKSNVKPEIIPGMLVQIEIIGKKRTIFEYIMKPILEVSSKALTEK